MQHVFVCIDHEKFAAKLRDELAPETCAASLDFADQAKDHPCALEWRSLLDPAGKPGFGCLGGNTTSYPEPGHLILYPDGVGD